MKSRESYSYYGHVLRNACVQGCKQVMEGHAENMTEGTATFFWISLVSTNCTRTCYYCLCFLHITKHIRLLDVIWYHLHFSSYKLAVQHQCHIPGSLSRLIRRISPAPCCDCDIPVIPAQQKNKRIQRLDYILDTTGMSGPSSAGGRCKEGEAV